MGLKTRSWASVAMITAMVVTFLGIAAYPASADPPDIVRIDLVTDPFVLADCGDFDILYSDEFQLTIQVFYNKDGDPIREHNIFTRGSATYENSETGKSITGGGSGVNSWDWESGTVAATGVFFKARIGSDTVLLDVGRIVIDLSTWTVSFSAGPKGVTGAAVGSDFGFGPLCEFLA